MLNRTVLSVCHSLKIIPLSRVTKYFRTAAEVRMFYTGVPVDLGTVPGTIRPSLSSDGGVYKKKISFEVSVISEETTRRLEAYKATRLIAVYVDESGRVRVSGSPSYPLTLDFTVEEGVFSVSLSGEDTVIDGFLS